MSSFAHFKVPTAVNEPNVSGFSELLTMGVHGQLTEIRLEARLCEGLGRETQPGGSH